MTGARGGREGHFLGKGRILGGTEVELGAVVEISALFRLNLPLSNLLSHLEIGLSLTEAQGGEGQVFVLI